MVHFDPMEWGLYCQVTIWPSKYRGTILLVCDRPYHTNKSTNTERGRDWGFADLNIMYVLLNYYSSLPFVWSLEHLVVIDVLVDAHCCFTYVKVYNTGVRQHKQVLCQISYGSRKRTLPSIIAVIEAISSYLLQNALYNYII